MEGFDIHDIAMQDINTLPRDAPEVVKALEKKEAVDAKKLKATAAKVAPKTSGEREPVAPKVADSKQLALLAHKINLYGARFGDRLQCKVPKTLPKTETQLRELLLEIENELQSRGGIEKADEMYCALAMGIENGTRYFNPLGWELAGPAANLSATVRTNKKAWEDTVAEFAIANAEWFMVSEETSRPHPSYAFFSGRARQAFGVCNAANGDDRRHGQQGSAWHAKTGKCGDNARGGRFVKMQEGVAYAKRHGLYYIPAEMFVYDGSYGAINWTSNEIRTCESDQYVSMIKQVRDHPGTTEVARERLQWEGPLMSQANLAFVCRIQRSNYNHWVDDTRIVPDARRVVLGLHLIQPKPR